MKQFFKLSFILLAILLPASANAKANGIDNGYYFYMSDIDTYGDTTVFFPIYLYNEGLVRGFVFDIYLPDDFQLIGINKANHLAANTEVVWVDNGNFYSIGTYNDLTNVVADPGNDIVLYLEIKIPDDAMGYYPIEMDNIQIVPEYDSLLSSYSSYTAYIIAPYSLASTIVNSIELNQTDAELIEGETLQLKATVLPDNATDKSVTWVSGNPSVATVGSTGLVTALASGTATITATTNDGSNLIASCVVTVTQSESSIINFADANVKAICVQNWDTNGDDELSKAEAAAVTSLNSVFSGNTTITTFNELRYFTGLTSIEFNAFNSCRNLRSVTIPNSVTNIGTQAFNNCNSLTTINIPNSVTSIQYLAFHLCTGLTSVNIPTSVTIINSDAFWGCNGLTSITIEDGNSVYDSRDNCNAIIETASNTLIAGCQNTVIPNSITSIGDEAFRDCIRLKSINIPNTVITIGRNAFTGCI